MTKLYRTIYHMQAAITTNTFLYFVGRLPLVGKRLPSRVFALGRLKTGLGMLVSVLDFLKDLMGKILYLAVMVVLPVVVIFEDSPGGLDTLVAPMAHILFVLSCVVGSLANVQAVNPSRDKYIAVKFMRISPRSYLRATLPVHYLLFFVTFLAPMLFLFGFCGSSAAALVLWVWMVATRFAGEALTLWVFRKTGKHLPVWAPVIWPIALVGLAAAYVPVLLGWPLVPLAWLGSLPGVVLALALGAAGIWYVWWGFAGYDDYRRALTAEKAAPVAKKSSAFADVQMKETDLENQHITPRLARKTGYDYLQGLFFTRHRRQLFRPVLIRLAVVGGVLAIFMLLLLVAGPAGVLVVQRLTSQLPLFVFLMYLASVAPKACRAMFYNCDISLLHYAFYRQPRVILRNFRIRLFYVAGHDLLIGAAVCVATSLAFALSGGQLFTFDRLIFCVTILLLALFFSVHHLFLYYVFQPYTTELDVKNPFFSIWNGIMYGVCYACLQIKAAGPLFVQVVLGITVLYILVALGLVYKLSPKSFRVK